MVTIHAFCPGKSFHNSTSRRPHLDVVTLLCTRAPNLPSLTPKRTLEARSPFYFVEREHCAKSGVAKTGEDNHYSSNKFSFSFLYRRIRVFGVQHFFGSDRVTLILLAE